jgi:hypothetical protein
VEVGWGSFSKDSCCAEGEPQRLRSIGGNLTVYADSFIDFGLNPYGVTVAGALYCAGSGNYSTITSVGADAHVTFTGFQMDSPPFDALSAYPDLHNVSTLCFINCNTLVGPCPCPACAPPLIRARALTDHALPWQHGRLPT